MRKSRLAPERRCSRWFDQSGSAAIDSPIRIPLVYLKSCDYSIVASTNIDYAGPLLYGSVQMYSERPVPTCRIPVSSAVRPKRLSGSPHAANRNQPSCPALHNIQPEKI
jgi:hypothetical protein